jgi:hypothetical protein
VYFYEPKTHTMKKTILFAAVLFASISFTSCTDLNDEDEFLLETLQIDPADDGSIDEEDLWEVEE